MTAAGSKLRSEGISAELSTECVLVLTVELLPLPGPELAVLVLLLPELSTEGGGTLGGPLLPPPGVLAWPGVPAIPPGV